MPPASLIINTPYVCSQQNEEQARDDVNWIKHSLYFKEGHLLDYKPVRLKPLAVDSFPLKARFTEDQALPNDRHNR